MKASEIAEFLGSELIGEDIEIDGVCSLENVRDNKLAFCKHETLYWIRRKALFIVGPTTKILGDANYIRVDNPVLAHARATTEFFIESHNMPPNGDGTLLATGFPHTSIYDCVKWGDRCFFFPGAVIGGSGFAFENDENGTPIRRPQVGGVIMGDGVEVGANCAIDRAALDNTIIGNNVKIDNMVHIAHNCVIGDNTCMAAGVILGGSVTVGKNCWLGMNATIMNQITIGDNVTIGIGAVVVKNVPDNTVIAGFMAQPIDKMRAFAKGTFK